MTKTHLAPHEEYGDIYVDQPDIMEQASMKMSNLVKCGWTKLRKMMFMTG